MPLCCFSPLHSCLAQDAAAISEYIQRCATEISQITSYQRQQLQGKEDQLAAEVLEKSGIPTPLLNRFIEAAKTRCRNAAVLEAATATAVDKMFERNEQAARRQDERKSTAESEAQALAIRAQQNPNATFTYDGQEAMGTRISYKPAGTTRTVAYQHFKRWVESMNGKWRPIMQSSGNLNGVSNHYRCKKDIADQWVQSFGYAHTRLDFAFNGAPPEAYNRGSVTNGVCMTTVMQLSGFGVNND